MVSRVTEYNPDTGEVEYFHENSDGSFTVESVQDVTPILEANIKRFNAAPDSRVDGASRRSEFRHVARIPRIILTKVLREEGIDLLAPENKDELRKRLNHPDWRMFRTHPSKL